MNTHWSSRAIALLGVAAGMLAAPLIAHADPDGAHWAGRYLFESAAAPTASGTVPVVSYTLVVADPPEARPAVLTIDGYQSDETILCDARESQGALVLSFRSYGDGRRTNRFGVSQYEMGQVLFVLSGDPSKRGNGLVTTWKKLVPDGVADAPGSFFHRIAPRKVAH